jgi:hypothetical protein
MRLKLDPNKEKKSHRGTPGPGTYKDINLESGKFVFSKFKDVSIPQINMNSVRFNK